MSESTITVITPFHNTDPELFSNAVSSMEKQRLSPDRIEWIIVVHNSDDDYLDFVREKTKQLPFVTIYELRNDKNTASSPRNFALEHVNGTYITFLDSDDMLTPECLSTIVDGMDETGADLGKYRGERRQEDEGISSFLDNRVRFSQTKRLLCFKNGDQEMNKLLTMANMMMSCQVIRADFLKEHQIRFREDIRYEEDVVFNLECLKFSSMIAVFPQMIGYIYYMHHGSTMQSTVISEERLLRICHDLSKQLDIGIDSGFDMRYLFMGHMKMIAEEIQKKEWDESVRKEIRDCFLRHYETIPLPESNDKFLTSAEIERISYETERVILGYDIFDDGADVLRQILKSNKGTELGTEWGFETIKTKEEYRKRVPVTSYDVYSPYIELTTRIGESDIFCSEAIKGYALTSGSSGRKKRIPYISKQLKENAEELRKLLSGDGSTFLLMQSIRSEEKYADGTYLDSITGAALQALEKELKFESFRLTEGDMALTTPKEYFFTSKGMCSYRKRLMYALLDRNVSKVVAPFTWYILDMFQYMERHFATLIQDMRDGFTLNGEKYPERAEELEKIFAEGFDTPILPKIWPNLKMVVADGSGCFRIYTKQLRRYVGDVLFHEAMYASSEGIFAIFDNEKSLYRLRTESNFYEFRERLSDGTKGDVLTMEDVRPGEKYELIVTNSSGFYRYAIGDIVQIHSRTGNEVLLELSYRKENVIEIPGKSEVITPDRIYDALDELIRKYELPVGDYCYKFSDDDKRFELYLEQAGYGDAQLASFDNETLAHEYDRLLRKLSNSYDSAREGVLDECRILYLEMETQALYREVCVKRSNLTPDQLKPVRNLDNPAKLKFFNTFIYGKEYED